MKQEIESNDLVNLGCVSTDTEGTNFVIEDSEGGMRLHAGLTDD